MRAASLARSSRPWAVGVALAALYLVVATVSFGELLPVRPLFDGLAPPEPYRWVRPPSGLEEGNEAPSGTGLNVDIGEQGSAAQQATTPDAQFSVVLPEGAFAPGTASPVDVAVRPLDPTRLAPAPEGRQFDSNAYEVRATAGGDPVEIVKPATIIVRYARAADRLFVLGGDRWERLDTTPFAGSLQLSSEPKTLGTFVATGDAEQLGAFAGHRRTPLWAFLLAGLGVSLGLGGGWWGWRRLQDRREAKRRVARDQRRTARGRQKQGVRPTPQGASPRKKRKKRRRRL